MKKVLYVIIGLGVVYLILCLVGAAESKVERSITINAPAEAVKNAVADHQIFHEKWSPWTEKDPSMKKTFEGTAGQPGHKLSWESENKEVGKGSMTLNSINGDSIIQTLHFDDYGDSKVYHIVKGADNSTSVTWGMQSKTPFFFRGMMLFMNMEEMIGPDFDKGLAKLKEYVEITSAPKAVAYDVKEVQWEEKTYVGKRSVISTADMTKLSAFFTDNYPKIFGDLGKNKIEPMGAPSAIFYKWDDEKKETDVAAVMQVAKGTKAKGWETFDIPASKVLHIAYYGAYDKSMDAHMAMDAYMKEKNLTQDYVLEEYVTDPMSEKDTAKWLTNIYYLIK